MFKHNRVKDFMDRFMPNRETFVKFKTLGDLEVQVVQQLNELHYGQRVVSDPAKSKYFINFTSNYAQLKCSCRPCGRECKFRYWFKFRTMPNSNCEGGVEYYDFELFRLINSNHSMPLH